MSSLWRALVILSLVLCTGAVACQPDQACAPSALSDIFNELKLIIVLF